MRTNNATNWLNGIKQYGRQFNDILKIYEDRGTGNYSTTPLGTFNQSDINRIQYSVDSDLLKSSMGKLVVDINLSSSNYSLLKKGRSLNYSLELLDDTGTTIDTCYYGYFTITEIEEQKDKKSVKVTCYDEMIKTMVDYESLGVTFPITISSFLNSIVSHFHWDYGISSLPNLSKQITSEHWLDADGNSLNYTFRDVLDDIAEAVGGIIYIKGKTLHLSSITKYANYTINEEYFSDKNVNIGEKYGPINKVTTNRGTKETGVGDICEIQILDNPILDQENGEDLLNDMWGYLEGIEYYLNDLQTNGLCLFEPFDRFNVSINNNTYLCILLHDSMVRTTGLKENINTEEPKQNDTAYKYESSLERTSRNAYIIANRSEGKIEQVVTTIGDNNGEVTSASLILAINENNDSTIKLDADQINLNGVVSANDYFKITTDGKVEINGGEINLNDNGQYGIPALNVSRTSGGNSFSTSVTSDGVIVNENDSNGDRYTAHYMNNDLFTEYYDDTNNVLYNGETSYYGHYVKFEDTNNSNNNKLGALESNRIRLVSYNNGSQVTKFDVYNGTYGASLDLDGDATIGGTTTTTDLSVSGDATITRLTLDGVNMNNYSGKRVNGASANDLGTGVFYLGSSSSNTPTNYLATLSVNGGTNDRAQFGMSVGGIEAYFRVKPTASWTDWKRLVYIEASGSNSNGNYIKYNDGTLIQWNRLSVKDQAISNSYGSMYIGTRAITFPVAFVGDNPSVQCSSFTWGTSASWGCVLGNSVSLTGCSLCGFDIASRSSGTNVYISWYAIGKWK